MNKNLPEFTTARLLMKTKLRAKRNYLIDGFSKLEDAIDYYINLGIKYNKQIKREKKCLQNN